MTPIQEVQMKRRLKAFSAAGGLLVSVFVTVLTLGTTPAHATSFEDWTTVSAGDRHTCAIRNGGELYCWGFDHDGRLGIGVSLGDPDVPLRVGTFADWANVSAGDAHTCGVRKNGKLYCWGLDNYGQVGDDDNPNHAITPRRIGTFLDWTTVSAGASHTCGIRGGKLYCWGRNDSSQVSNGDDDPGAVTTPRLIGTFEDWANVDAGASHTCGVRKNGKLYCWGLDHTGQVGDGTNPDHTTPQRIGTFEDWANASAGVNHSCGVRKNGKLYCWGNDGQGQVGDGGSNEIAIITPRRIGTFEDWANSSAGKNHTCGVRKNGKLYCWGNDSEYEVGDGGSNSAAITTPKHIAPSLLGWHVATAGSDHSCAIRDIGKLYCWGYDGEGQVGDGNTPGPATTPRRL